MFKIRRSGTYASFFLMGVLAQVALLILMFRKLLENFALDEIAFAFLMTSLFFFTYRFFMDWRIFKNELSREMRDVIIRDSAIYKIKFALIMAFFMAVSNIKLFIFSNFITIWIYSVLAILIAWTVHEGLRELHAFFIETKLQDTQEVKING